MKRFALGNDRFVVVKRFNGEMKIHIRQYERNTMGNLYPSKTGICMSPMRFVSLVGSMGALDIDKLVDKSLQFKSHVGGGVYLTASIGFSHVHIRQFFKPLDSEEEKPTKKGIALSLNEYKELVACIEDVKNVSDEIANATPCYQGLDHCNQIGYFTCPECSPFSHADY